MARRGTRTTTPKLLRAKLFAGICPACGRAVYTDDPRPPVWTCPADLSDGNPYRQEMPDGWRRTEADMEADGCFSQCNGRDNFACPIEWYGSGHLPLHAKCYDTGTW